MPFKDINKKRESYRKWSKRNHEKRNFQSGVSKASIRANPVIQPCSFVECKNKAERHHPDYSKPKEVIWLCKQHHELIHHKEYRKCSEDGCARKHWAKGRCLMHLKRWDRKKYA
jgi:hypothetical protein